MSEEFKIPTEQDLSPVLVTQRAEEIAASDGRTAAEVSDADYARAREELSQPVRAEQRQTEPVDGFRRADIAMATQGTQATTGYEDDAQIGAHLVEDGIQAAVQDEFVAAGRATLADAADEEPEPELEAATFTQPASIPSKPKPVVAAKPKARATSKPAAKKAAPKKAAKPVLKKAAKKVSPPAKKKAPAKAKPKLKAKPKANAKPAKATVKTKPKAKAKAQPKPKKAVKKASKKAAKRAKKTQVKAKAKASKPKPKAKAKTKKAAKKRKR